MMNFLHKKEEVIKFDVCRLGKFLSDNSSFQESRVFENRKQIKGINIYNILFEVLICVICMIYIQYMFRLPREDTIITFKVRMDN